MPTISGCHVENNRGLAHWNALLKKWLLAHERFCRICENDPAYRYTERPNVGILAAAAWCCGMIALQEFWTTRQVPDQEGQEPWVGRGDLRICTDNDDNTKYLIEAKHKWVSLWRNNWVPSINDCMREATNDANNAQTGQPDATAIAVVFASLYAPPTFDINNIDQRIVQFCETINGETINEELDCHALAWYFPEETRRLRGGGNCYYPGIAMLAKNVSFE